LGSNLDMRVLGYTKSLCIEGTMALARWLNYHTMPQVGRDYKKAGGEALRYQYDLGPQSVILDVGGYLGDFAAEVLARFGSRVHCFEPIAKFRQAIVERLGRNPQLTVHPFGLGAKTEEVMFCVVGAMSSSLRDQERSEACKVVSVVDFFANHDIQRVDLMKINIEGGEFQLLPAMIDAGLHERVVDFQIQFHQFVPDADAKRDSVRNALSRTHHVTWEFPYVWENWRRNDAASGGGAAVQHVAGAAK
jgi:FkbM family methyltransferase